MAAISKQFFEDAEATVKVAFAITETAIPGTVALYAIQSRHEELHVFLDYLEDRLKIYQEEQARKLANPDEADIPFGNAFAFDMKDTFVNLLGREVQFKAGPLMDHAFNKKACLRSGDSLTGHITGSDLVALMGRSVDDRDGKWLMREKPLNPVQREFALRGLDIFSRYDQAFNSHCFAGVFAAGMLNVVSDHAFWKDALQKHPQIFRTSAPDSSALAPLVSHVRNDMAFPQWAVALGNHAALRAAMELNLQCRLKIENIDLPVEQYLCKRFSNPLNPNEKSVSVLHRNMLEEEISGTNSDLHSFTRLHQELIDKMQDRDFYNYVNGYCKFINLVIGNSHEEEPKYRLHETLWKHIEPRFKRYLANSDESNAWHFYREAIQTCNPEVFQAAAERLNHLPLPAEDCYKSFAAIISANEKSIVPAHQYPKMARAMDEVGINLNELVFDGGQNLMHFAAKNYLADDQLSFMGQLLEYGVNHEAKDGRKWKPESYLSKPLRENWKAILQSNKAREIAQNSLQELLRELKP